MSFPITAQDIIDLARRNLNDREPDGLCTRIQGYHDQVNQLWARYKYGSQYGSSTIRTVVNKRVKVVAGQGVSVDSENEEIRTWITNFLEVNGLLGRFFRQGVLITELEGLCVLTVTNKKKTYEGAEYPRIQMLSYLSNGLRIALDNFGDLSEVYVSQGKGKADMIQAKNCVAIATSGIRPNADDVEDTKKEQFTNGIIPPICSTVLFECEALDRAIDNWRTLNGLFSVAPLMFQTQTPAPPNLSLIHI